MFKNPCTQAADQMHVIREPKFFLLCEKNFVILSFTMTKKTDDFVRGRILESYQSLNSYRAVSDHLLEDGISVSYVTVKNIVDADRKKEQRKSTRKKSARIPESLSSGIAGLSTRSRKPLIAPTHLVSGTWQVSTEYRRPQSLELRVKISD